MWYCASWEMSLQTKYFRETERIRLEIAILKKRTKFGGLTLTDFKIDYKSLEIKTIW